ncbi:MAG: hypothetical protein J1E39_07285 [Eubacterium sp.]|nr:hypothetical protein [Eubacterium sp.]
MSEKKKIESRMKADSEIFRPSDKVWDNIKDAPIDVKKDPPKKGVAVLKIASVAACAAVVVGGVAVSFALINNNTPAAQSSEAEASASGNSSIAIGMPSDAEQSQGQADNSGTSEIYTEEIAKDCDDVEVYYINDDGETVSEKIYLELDPDIIYEEWYRLNKVEEKVGDKVELLSVSIADNGWEESTESTVAYHPGDYFMLNIVVSNNIMEYGDNYEQLTETLKTTMSEYHNIEFDEINVLLSGVIIGAEV